MKLVAAGLWRPFHRTRDRYKIGGREPPEAYQAAFDDFFPNGLGYTPILPANCYDEPTSPGAVGDDGAPASERTKKALGENDAIDIVSGSGRNDIGMVPKGALDGKSADRAEVVDWVARNVAVEKVTLAGCPSSEAWGMLRWVRMSLINEGEFWKTLYKALLPSRTEIESADRFKDEGQHIFRVIDHLEKKVVPKSED